jgi:hypothetical protein
VNGLVLDTSALLCYASGTSIEPGSMLTLAEDDDSQEVWIPALCLTQAHFGVAGSAMADTLDLLLAGDRAIRAAILDGPTARRVAGVGAALKVGLDVAHAIVAARLYRCYLVPAEPDALAVAPELDLLDISQDWD